MGKYHHTHRSGLLVYENCSKLQKCAWSEVVSILRIKTGVRDYGCPKDPLETQRYFEYPGDGWNNWKVLVQTGFKTFVGTTRVYGNGTLQNPITASGIFSVDPSWKELTLTEAIKLSE